MTNETNILLITRDKMFYNSFKKVLGLISGIEVFMARDETELSDYLSKEDNYIDIIVLKETTRSKLYKWLWNVIRISNNSPLPFIALGNREIDSINEDARDIVFEKRSENHQYLEMPFRLTDIFYSISESQAVELKELKYLIDKFGKPTGIIREILRHDIPIELSASNIGNSIKLYRMVKKLIVEYGIHEELIPGIDNEIHNVETTTDIKKEYHELKDNSIKLVEVLS
jgi:hypothetical protein